jgi:SOS-response transcriptional repressor LexA
MKKATDRQIVILNYIIKYKQDHGRSPSFREIADANGINGKGAFDHVEALVKKGYLETTPKISRSIVVLRLPEAV